MTEWKSKTKGIYMLFGLGVRNQTIYPTWDSTSNMMAGTAKMMNKILEHTYLVCLLSIKNFFNVSFAIYLCFRWWYPTWQSTTNPIQQYRIQGVNLFVLRSFLWGIVKLYQPKAKENGRLFMKSWKKSEKLAFYLMC